MTTERKKRHSADAADARPTIKVAPGEIERVVDESERALAAAGRGLYQRDGRIVYVADTPMLTASGLQVTAQRIVERGDHALLEDLATAAVFLKFDARVKDFVAIDPPLAVAKTLRQRVGRLRLPILTGVVNAPTLREDGSLISKPGYDTRTGLLYDPLGVVFPPVPDRPTRADALRALGELQSLIRSFPFVAEADRAVALSAIFSALARRSVATAPLHAFTAPVAGSGKSKLVDIASIIATGREAGVIAQGSAEAELEKRLGATLLAGDAVVSIDNCEAQLGGVLLCQMLSQSRVKTRILGESSTPEMTSGAFVAATGNNLTLVGDLTRRALLCRLDPGVERPEMRVFDFEPVALAKANRPALVTAALIVLRAFTVAKPRLQASPLGSFEEWSALIRGALVWLGCADPVDSQAYLRAADPKLLQISAVMANWREIIGPEKVTVADVIAKAIEKTPQAQEFREALLAIAGVKGAINARALGLWLSGVKNRIVEGAKFVSLGARHKVALWQLSTDL